MSKAGRIRVGIGGWVFEPWRGTFYPKGLSQKRELEHASRQVTAIEINGTYYGSQKPESFTRWHDETPDDFMFTVKGPRFATNRRILAEAGGSIEKFFSTGVLALKDKLGPINWQFLPTKRFEPGDFEAFLKLLPPTLEGRAIRHVVELRHESFRDPACIEMLRAHGIAAVVADSDKHPLIADVTAPFVYARLQNATESAKHGYAPKTLDLWASRAQAWAAGGANEELGLLAGPPEKQDRDVFVFMINGFKPKAPAAARALIARLS